MSHKTYALFDLIGITDSIRNGSANTVLENFWNAADAWTNGQNHGPMSIPNAGYTACPIPCVATFSDSALMYTEEELEIDDFYSLVKDLKRYIESRACTSYVIISRNSEISQPSMPALGGYVSGLGGTPRYTRIAGSGEAWVDLHLADKAIGKAKEWHGKYSIYCVGKNSLPRNGKFLEVKECEGLSGKTNVYAIA